MNVSKTMLSCLILIGSLCGQSVVAQSEALKDAERSTIVFDVNVKKFRDSSMMKDFDLKRMMNKLNVPNTNDVEVSKMNRVYGSIQVPESPLTLHIGPGEDLPLNFYLRFEFKDKDSAEEMFNEIKDGGSDTHEVNGKTYYSPNDGRTPPNLRLHRIDDTTFEMGTEKYVMQSDRNFLTKRLADFWKQVPGSTAMRLSLDIESNRAAVSELIEMAKLNVPAEVEGMLNLVGDMHAFTMGVDLDAKKMLMLRASAKDSEATEKLRKGLDGILAMGKYAGMQQVQNSDMEEEEKKTLTTMLSGLKATADGNVVSINIEKADGLENVVDRLKNQ